ncbi:hypothetical protein [Amycolatopsis sp. NPDC051371]|uniref:hypothetical protein n=1 Tax=Amycolatopsis sp. NPDC051371 TaxID=3155800 RepID=UPI0034304B9D
MPVLTAENCSARLPAWGVTREFRFGQFVRLYDERMLGGKRQVTPLLLSADGDILQTGTSGATADGGHLPGVGAPNAPTTGRTLSLQAVEAADLDRVVTGTAKSAWKVDDVEQLVRTGVLHVRGATVSLDLGPLAVRELRAGREVAVMARVGDAAPDVVRLQPTVASVSVDGAKLDSLIAAREIGAGTKNRIRLDERTLGELARHGEAVAPTWREGRVNGLAKVTVASGTLPATRPAAERIGIRDVVEFLSAPIVPTTDGGSAVVPLDATGVRALLQGEPVTTAVGDREVTLYPLGFKAAEPGLMEISRAYVLDPKYTRYDLGRLRRELYRFGTATVDGGAGNDDPQANQPPQQQPAFTTQGLPVAILLPWKQTWRLKGFSRGNLVSSLALAPGEEMTIAVSSWERRTKSLAQSSETDVEQNFDFTSTTRDTEDVFREVTQSNEFNAQAHGSLDASYSNGVASVHLEAGGQVSNTTSLATTARNSTQHVRESTTRAATRVRSRRITTIAESVERTTTNQVVRTIRNPNDCHTLTLNFHEVLAHYDVDIRFVRPAVRVVVLVPNPVDVKFFDELTARVNEATLREGLLDPALADGFDACRLLAAYGYAEAEIRRLASEAKLERELDREREKKKKPDGSDDDTKPENPQLKPLLALLTDLKRRWSPYPTADVDGALTAIAGWNTPTAPQVKAAQQWLWTRLLVTKFGTGIPAALGDLAATPGPDDARRIVAAVPAQGGAPPLDGLVSLTEGEKENAGLFSRVSVKGGPWWWWYPRVKDNGLYNADDGGIPGLLNQLRTTFQAWESKEAEGTGMLAAAEAVAQAQSEQTQTTIADKLEMKFGSENVGAAMERRQALLAHLNAHRDYYRFVLFQGMPPSEQLQRLMEIAPQLTVGSFEPHVVASDGPNLAVPLTPLAETALAKLVKNLSDILEKAAEDAQAAGDEIATDHTILTTPGLSVESWLGGCSGCEEHLEKRRSAQVRLSVAQAREAELHADRLAARLTATPPDLTDPSPPVAPTISVHVDDD